MRQSTMGVIVGHREVFPGTIAEKGRTQLIGALERAGVKVVTLQKDATRFGAVSCLDDAEKYARLFREKGDEIDGIFVSLPDFSDESSIATSIRASGLTVPVFVHAFADSVSKFGIKDRRDSFCGKLSVCNNLKQHGIRYSVGDLHVTDPDSESFASELAWFLGVCRVVNGIRSARVGCIGARTPDFRTVRYSEKLLERSGISVETVDLTDITQRSEEMSETDAPVKARIEELNEYCFSTGNVPARAVKNIAAFSLAVSEWVQEKRLDTYALQCWPSLQKSLQIFPCTFMSLMSNNLLPSACETDVLGALSMYALQLASGTASALFDLNNNYGDDPDKMVIFHCSNCPTSLMNSRTATYNSMAASRMGEESSFSTLSGNLKPGPLTYARIMTNDLAGRMTSYLGEAEVTNDEVETFGTVGVVRIERLQKLLKFLCKQGFEHHVAINASRTAGVLREAFGDYLDWDVYYHNDPE